MIHQEKDTHPPFIDEYFRGEEQNIPVVYNADHWQSLQKMLDLAQAPSAPPPAGDHVTDSTLPLHSTAAIPWAGILLIGGLMLLNSAPVASDPTPAVNYGVGQTDETAIHNTTAPERATPAPYIVPVSDSGHIFERTMIAPDRSIAPALRRAEQQLLTPAAEQTGAATIKIPVSKAANTHFFTPVPVEMPLRIIDTTTGQPTVRAVWHELKSKPVAMPDSTAQQQLDKPVTKKKYLIW